MRLNYIKNYGTFCHLITVNWEIQFLTLWNKVENSLDARRPKSNSRASQGFTSVSKSPMKEICENTKTYIEIKASM